MAAGLLISALAGPTWILFLAQFGAISDDLLGSRSAG